LQIYVINLKRAVERRRFMEEQLRRLGLAYTLFEAVEGRALDPDRVEQYDRAARLRRYGADLSPGEIGVYLSHYRIFEEMGERGIERALILEDDALLSDDMVGLLPAMAALPPGYELIRLSGARMPRHLTAAPLGAGHSLVRPLNVVCGSTGYVLTAGGAAKLRRAARCMTRQIDVTIDRYWDSGVRMFAVLPYPISPAGLTSTIGERLDVWDHPGRKLWRIWTKLQKFGESMAKRRANLAILAEHAPALISPRRGAG
jgi:glycosyl transferase family 25